ncbi:type II toxin-antitoxin system HicA family toxin [Pasteurella canis]|uniref:type II toxin-antitoxin system HicA family toxin n=1 Tax=Pasteurella canis TaxID=753 RepID=UPI001E4A3E53|nr:type II toxin-antitoxin system HicA family toxin [Pasteurella canis]UEA16620.1 type II toxin-antitoxin system HicA family toxin [Pasteurella canis]GJJ80033.1 hypothetical protein PcPA57_07530 [Pasteurella canis]
MATKYSSNKDLHQYIKILVVNGWRYIRRSKHAKLISPDQSQQIFVSISPSDKRALMKLKSNIKQIGFKLFRN